MVWMLAAFAGLFFGPLLFAVWRPTAPISQPILWLQRTSGFDGFILVYTLTMIVLIGIIRTGSTFFEHAVSTPKREPIA
jgi:hypothetical protein